MCKTKHIAVFSIDKELIKYFFKLNEPQKKSLLQMIKTFTKSEKGPGESISIEQYNKELDEAMIRLDERNFTTFEELQKEMQSW